MSAEPDKFHIGMIDFFSVILPGALLTFQMRSLAEEGLFGNHFPTVKSDTESWIVFLVIAYILGHFIFLLGSWLDRIYDAMLERLLPKKDNLPCLEAMKIMTRHLDSTGIDNDEIKVFQWIKCLLAISHPTALNHVQRFEADSKFFRSLVVVLIFLMAFKRHNILMLIVYLVLIGTSVWRYGEQRFISTRQGYCM
jgi:hypothetical protein